MIKFENKICIFGTGGFGRETLCCLIDCISNTKYQIEEIACFMINDEYYNDKKIMGVDVIPLSKFDPENYEVVVAIGDPPIRRKIVQSFQERTRFISIIHPSVKISKWVDIGEGSILTSGVITTCNITIGKHSHLNLHSTIGHDCKLGDFLTTAPGVNISGNCSIGNCVYVGSNATIKQGIKICDNVTIGMGGVVVKNIDIEGVYIGNPVKKFDKI